MSSAVRCNDLAGQLSATNRRHAYSSGELIAMAVSCGSIHAADTHAGAASATFDRHPAIVKAAKMYMLLRTLKAVISLPLLKSARSILGAVAVARRIERRDAADRQMLAALNRRKVHRRRLGDGLDPHDN